MRSRSFLASLSLLPVLCVCGAGVAQGQDQQPDVMWTTGGSQGAGGQGPRAGQEGRRPGVFGKITAIQSDSIEVTAPNGNKVTLKLTGSTEFRRDRQPAKLSDFKVGDAVMVRTDQANGNPTTAVMVAAGGFAMPGQGEGGGRGQGQGGGAGMMAMAGTLGKDYVLGEVKTIDVPKLTIMRPDNVMQTLELNEETSLRKGRDSITMADIQAGDHVFARGAVQNNVFVPKDVRVIPPEMWNRMQGMNGAPGAPATPNATSTPNAPGAPSAPAPPPSPKSPPEPQN
jgi:Cu/Ag efflux protein CusF